MTYSKQGTIRQTTTHVKCLQRNTGFLPLKVFYNNQDYHVNYVSVEKTRLSYIMYKRLVIV